MKNAYMLIALLFLVSGKQLAQQLNNSGLESWQSFSTFEVPDYFYTMDQILNMGLQLVTKTTDSHSGQYAAVIQTRLIGATPLLGGLSYGKFEQIGNTNYFKGWAFATRPEKIKFWYKYFPSGQDTAQITMLLSKGAGNLKTFVGVAYFKISSTVSNYTLAELPVIYSAPDNPDTIGVSFISSGYSIAQGGSKLYIDDLALDYTSGANDFSKDIPADFSLNQNYPNPFNPATTIEFSVPTKTFVSLKIFNLLGNEESVLVSEELMPGRYSRIWNAEKYSGGVYFYRLNADNYSETKKLILLK